MRDVCEGWCPRECVVRNATWTACGSSVGIETNRSGVQRHHRPSSSLRTVPTRERRTARAMASPSAYSRRVSGERLSFELCAVVLMYRTGTRRVWGQRIVPVECNWGGAGRRPSASGPEIRLDVVDAMRSDASRGCGVAPFEGLGDPAGSLGPQEGHTLPPRGSTFSASISLASHAVSPACKRCQRP